MGLNRFVDQPQGFVEFRAEQITDQKIGDVSLAVRVLSDEATETEARVVGTDQLPHSFHAAEIVFFPATEL